MTEVTWSKRRFGGDSAAHGRLTHRRADPYSSLDSQGSGRRVGARADNPHALGVAVVDF